MNGIRGNQMLGDVPIVKVFTGTEKRKKSTKINSLDQFLYRHFDKDGILLYVGISISTLHRLSQHKRKSSWFHNISSVTIEKFDSRKEVLAAEKEAIQNGKPLYNFHNNKIDCHIKKIKCSYCEVEFTPRRSWNRFCSNNCRHQQWEEDNPRVKKANRDL